MIVELDLVEGKNAIRQDAARKDNVFSDALIFDVI
jgi:hypothetical protein